MYYGFADLMFWFWFLIFFPIIYISFYIPGEIASSKLKINNVALRFAISNVLGIVLWGFQGYIFGYLNLRVFTYLYCLVSVFYFFTHLHFIKKELFMLIETLKGRYSLIVLILIGSICQMPAIFFSGIKYANGIKFFGNNSADGVMHAAYINSIVSHFPPQEPGLTGVLIHNYHYWTDLVLADLVRIWNLPILNLYFQYTPVYLSVLTGIVAYILVKQWGGSKKMGYWFIFMLYFASDAAYLVLLALHKPLGFYTPAIDSSILQFLNMPHVFGKLIFLSGLITFYKWNKSKSFSWGIITAILCSSLFGFKIYFGLFIAIGFVSYLLVTVFLKSIKNRKILINLQELSLIFLFFLMSFAIFFPHNRGAGGFVFVYLEWPRSLLGFGSIDWTDWWLRRQVYVAANNIRNIAILDALSVIIALISIYGTRLLGFFVTKGFMRFLGLNRILILFPALFIFHILGFFTIQSSGGVNVFNFFSVSSVVLSLFSSYLLSKIKFSKLGIVILVIFVVLTIPRSIYEVKNNLEKFKNHDYSLISNDEIEAFNYIKLKTDSDAIVQASPDNAMDKLTPYVSLFSNRKSFIGGGGLLMTHNINITARKTSLETIFRSTEIVDFVTKIKQKGISYIYLQKNPEQELKFKIDEAYLKKVFENGSVLVLHVN